MAQLKLDKPILGKNLDYTPGHYVRVVSTESRPVEVGPTYNHVEVNLSGKLPWLQNLLLKALYKLGAIKRPWREMTYQTFTIERKSDSVMEQLHDAICDIEDRYDHTPTVCYMGMACLQTLMRQRMGEDMQLDMINWSEEIRSGRGRIMNMRINVVPWIDGIFLV